MPSNARFAAALNHVFLQQSRELWSKIDATFIQSGKRVNLAHWADDPRTLQALMPFLLREWQAGIRESARQVVREGHPVNTRHLRQEMMAELKEQGRKLLKETGKTTQDAINSSLREARRRMKKGRSGLVVVQAEIESKLRNKVRSQGIADNEAEFAHNAGRMLVFQESEAGWKVWETVGPNPCPKCKALNGKIVRIDEPFYVNPKGGPYAVVMHPTLHNHCYCRVRASFVGPRKRSK